jgi:hypothetical protein
MRPPPPDDRESLTFAIGRLQHPKHQGLHYSSPITFKLGFTPIISRKRGGGRTELKGLVAEELLRLKIRLYLFSFTHPQGYRPLAIEVRALHTQYSENHLFSTVY